LESRQETLVMAIQLADRMAETLQDIDGAAN
jgi:hypothetical protein